MATSKKAAAKKSSLSRSVSRELPVQRIVVEIVIRNETTQQQSAFMDGAPLANNFSYTFSRKNATILKIFVEGWEQSMPPDTGSFYATVLDPNTPKKVLLIVVARQDLPGGTATIQLKYNGKDVFTPAKDIVFNNGIGGIHERITLP